jgi:hypothetical protein
MKEGGRVGQAGAKRKPERKMGRVGENAWWAEEGTWLG